MAKNKNNKVVKNNARRKQQKAVNCKSSLRGGGKRMFWSQPNHLQHYQDIPTEYYTEPDLDPPSLKKPSLAHLDLDDIELQDPTANRFSALDQLQENPSRYLISTTTTTDPTTYRPSQQDDSGGDFYFDDKPADINITITTDANPDDCFFFDETPADISFPHPTIIINNNASNTKNQGGIPSTTPDIQSISTGSKRTKQKRRQHRNKVQKGKKIIPGDDIYIEISSDDESLMPSTSKHNKISDIIEINSDNDDGDMTYTFHEESALDQDFIENTDPDTWQHLQQWATKRSVDEQQYEISDDDQQHGISNDFLGMDINDDGDPIADFGLDDSEDDEFIQQHTAHRQQQQDSAQHLQRTIHNTLPGLPPSLHAGMHGFLQHNRRYTSSKKKSSAPEFSHHTTKDMDTYSGQLRRIDRRIQLFLGDPSRQIYRLPEMTVYCKQLVQGLASIYHIKVASENLKERKVCPSLKKCPNTQLPKDRRKIEKYIDKAQIPERTKRHMERRSGSTIVVKSSSTTTRKEKGQRQRRSIGGGRGRGGFRSGNTTTAHVVHGTVVGSAAAPLASDNVGHKMLAKMGWKNGDALGTNKEGITDPIQVVIRDRRRGLGA